MFLRYTLAAALAVVGTALWAEDEKPAANSPLATIGPRPNPVETPSAEAIDASIGRGVEFLLKRQNKNGSWGSARNTKA